MKSFRILIWHVAANRTGSDKNFVDDSRNTQVWIPEHLLSQRSKCDSALDKFISCIQEYPDLVRTLFVRPESRQTPTSGGPGTTLDPFWYHSRSVLVVLYRSGN
jgi:hypothetical protein